jgi:hypothetical protein
MQCYFAPTELFLEQRMCLQHLLYRRRCVQVIVLNEIDELTSVVARFGKRCEARCVVPATIERDEFDRVFTPCEYPTQRRNNVGWRVVIKDAQDDVGLGLIDRSDKRLRTPKHNFAFGGTDVSMRAMHAYVGMGLEVDVEFHRGG